MKNNRDMQNKHIPNVSIAVSAGNATFKPLITTIIPTYRRPKLLQRAIKSVLNQTYPHFQVCIYNNASGDETANVVTEFAQEDSRVRYHCHKENIGAAKNFIYGMEQVNTEFFSFLSDDDVLLPDFYKTAINGLSVHPEAMFAATQVIIMSLEGKVMGRDPDYFPQGIYYPPAGFQTMVKHGPPTWTGILFRKEVIKKVGLPDPTIGWPSDYEYELRIASRCPYLFIGHPGAIFYHHELSSTGNRTYVLDCPSGRLEMLRRIENDYGLPSSMAREAVGILRRRHIKALTNSAIYSAFNGDTENVNRATQLLQKMYSCKTISGMCSLFAVAAKNSWFRNLLDNYLRYRIGKSRQKLSLVQQRYGSYAKYLRD